MRVLVVEDDLDIVKVLSRGLGVLGHIMFTQTVETAIEYLSQGFEIDLIFSDYNLAGDKTGGDLLDWVKANRPELVEKFIFISGNPIVETLHDRAIEKHDIKSMKAAILSME